MARRYDSRTTTFSPEGRLYQVEYALEAINNASSTLGIVAKDGVVLAADKMVTSKLLDQGRAKEKIYKVDDHMMCAVAGLTADANILIAQARLIGQRYLYAYQEPQPIEQLVVQICDIKQDWNEDLDVDGALLLAAKVLNKTMDTAMPSAEKLEIAIIKKNPENESQLLQVVLSNEEVTQLMKKAQEIQAQEQAPAA
ncbi:UNVERIFIED_CONTAM: hypothetical protein H355_005765 [Colinus virginianus]|nr:hypothetical protein H355_005765 [Colinus virginianus]